MRELTTQTKHGMPVITTSHDIKTKDLEHVPANAQKIGHTKPYSSELISYWKEKEKPDE